MVYDLSVEVVGDIGSNSKSNFDFGTMNRSLILFFFFDDEDIFFDDKDIFFDDEDDPDDTDEFADDILTRFSLLATGERLFLGEGLEEADGDSVVLMGVSVEVSAMLESVVLLELELCNLGLLSPSSLS